MLSPDLYDRNFEDLLKSLNYSRDKRVRLGKTTQRINELSTPKKQHLNESEDYIGPGSYNPEDKFLSTKCKSPSIRIGKSSRFKYTEIHPLRNTKSSNLSSKKTMCKSLNLTDTFSSPKYSFKRTGHNLKLVENPNFPGVGKYSPRSEKQHKAFSFKKSKRNFDWKNDIKKLPKLVDFDRKYS
ncbi:hypothetical protein SteCoe_1636 [Stentor coeruleus]|uniref:Uncharacterized protein n=1 Tax=Stentor coeruleus TaxID=5963 RepID=A0A1R2D1G3_9CILI|nr:hypothetical protein SteCoe_1636 [Stentor coeruleus]